MWPASLWMEIFCNPFCQNELKTLAICTSSSWFDSYSRGLIGNKSVKDWQITNVEVRLQVWCVENKTFPTVFFYLALDVWDRKDWAELRGATAFCWKTTWSVDQKDSHSWIFWILPSIYASLRDRGFRATSIFAGNKPKCSILWASNSTPVTSSRHPINL